MDPVSYTHLRGGLGRRLLSLPPVVYLGRISYGTYLWHWLVIVVLVHETDLGSGAVLAVTVPVATGLASLSYQLLEMPVRTAPVLDRLRSVTLASGVIVSLLVGLMLAPRILDGGSPASPAPSVRTFAGSGGVDPDQVGAAFFDFFDYETCPSSQPTACTFVTGSSGTAMVVGDSHAATYAPMLTDLARRHDLTLYGGLLAYCPWTRGIRYKGVGPNCLSDQARLFDEILPELDPDIVFLAHMPVDDPNAPVGLVDADAGQVTGAERDERLAARITTLVERLVDDGRTVVLFEPMPVSPADLNPLSCLQEEAALEPCRFVTSRGPGAEDRLINQLDDAEPAVVSIDLDLATCPFLPICDPMLDGKIVRRDGNHLTVSFARSLLDQVDAYLVDEGVVG